MVNVNAAEAEGAEMSIGGATRFAYGRELGPLYVEEFLNKHLFYVSD